MTDIASQHIAWIKNYAACMTRENWADMQDRILHQAEELSRLTAFPLPGEIAEQVELLKHLDGRNREVGCKAAAALQRLVQEVERLKERNATWEWAVRGKDKQIGELFDAAKEQGDEIDRLRARIAELEAEQDEWIKLCTEWKRDRDAIKTKTIEECHKAVWDAGGDNAEYHCAAIRELLNQPEASSSGKE